MEHKKTGIKCYIDQGFEGMTKLIDAHQNNLHDKLD